jgi:Delta3-Delta2-enoyl-CoA isomerase
MPESIIDEPTVALDRYDGNIFVITMRKAPENRLNSEYAQKLISIFNEIRRILGTSTEGAVITKGNDAKFWCTVSRTRMIVSNHPPSI